VIEHRDHGDSLALQEAHDDCVDVRRVAVGVDDQLVFADLAGGENERTGDITCACSGDARLQKDGYGNAVTVRPLAVEREKMVP
jgi:hypothetical protein